MASKFCLRIFITYRTITSLYFNCIMFTILFYQITAIMSMFCNFMRIMDQNKKLHHFHLYQRNISWFLTFNFIKRILKFQLNRKIPNFSIMLTFNIILKSNIKLILNELHIINWRCFFALYIILYKHLH